MRLSLFLIVLLVLHIAHAETSPRPELSVNANSTVASGIPVTLADLGGASFVTSLAMEKANSLVVFNVMSDREEKTFTNAELVRVLKEKVAMDASLSGFNWTYFVPEKVTVKAAKNHISQNRISTQILQALTDRCENCSFRLRDLKLPLVSESAPLTSLELDTSSLKPAGSFLLPLRVGFSGSQKLYYVSGTVAAKEKALVTTRSLRMGEKIEANDVKIEEMEIQYANDAFATLEDLTDKTAARMLQMGRPIYKSDLRKESVVLRGQMIRAVSGNEMFEVSTQMTAEENGALGDTIKLKNPETQKTLSGKITDRGVVRIQ